MDRQQATMLLKELLVYDLVDEPSFVSLGEKQPNNYQIKIRCNYNRDKIMKFAKKDNLAVKEDEEQKFLVIYKP